MTLEEGATTRLARAVLDMNLQLRNEGLVKRTWGNASAVDRDLGLVIIKPSGVPYGELTAAELPVLTLSGEQIRGRLAPSTDTPAHLVLYAAFPEIGAVVHTHSTWATAWAQAGRSIPVLGTTHADHFHREVPCTRELTDTQVAGNYEHEIGLLIASTVGSRNPLSVPAVLVHGHGPFVWGIDTVSALENAIVLEEVAKTAFLTICLSPEVSTLRASLISRHYFRKHGTSSYYGQPKPEPPSTG
jgi:L-ribulose-5-phosphate 4-epimerase